LKHDDEIVLKSELGPLVSC